MQPIFKVRILTLIIPRPPYLSGVSTDPFLPIYHSHLKYYYYYLYPPFYHCIEHSGILEISSVGYACVVCGEVVLGGDSEGQ